MLTTTVKRRAAAIALAAAATYSVGAYATSALFMDTVSVTGNAFTSSKVDLAVAPVSTIFNATDIIPGTVITTPVTVTNATGSVPLRYALRSVTTGDAILTAALTYTLRTGVSSCTTANFTATGTQVYTGVPGSPGGTAIFGNPDTGAHAGDRTLAAAASEVLCMQIRLPANADHTVSFKSITATFTFSAEQTANNP